MIIIQLFVLRVIQARNKETMKPWYYLPYLLGIHPNWFTRGQGHIYWKCNQIMIKIWNYFSVNIHIYLFHSTKTENTTAFRKFNLCCGLTVVNTPQCCYNIVKYDGVSNKAKHWFLCNRNQTFKWQKKPQQLTLTFVIYGVSITHNMAENGHIIATSHCV